MSERHGVEVDYCPQCRGMWLDRGELDKILDTVKSFAAPAQPGVAQVPPRQPAYDQRAGYSDKQYGDAGYRKKKSPFEFLGDILG